MIISLIATNGALDAPTKTLSIAEARASAILLAAEAARIPCAAWEAARLAAVPAAKQDCRKAVLLAASLAIGWEASSILPSGEDAIFAASVAKAILLAFAEGGVGGGWVDPGAASWRPLGCLLEGVAHPLQHEGGWRRRQAASGGRWDAAAIAAAGEVVTDDPPAAIKVICDRLQAITDDPEVCPEDRAYLGKVIDGLRAVDEIRRRKALLAIAASIP